MICMLNGNSKPDILRIVVYIRTNVHTYLLIHAVVHSIVKGWKIHDLMCIAMVAKLELLFKVSCVKLSAHAT